MVACFYSSLSLSLTLSLSVSLSLCLSLFLYKGSVNIFKQVIADFLSTEEVEDIKELFRKMDTDNDGIVSVDELKSGLRNFESQLSESEVQMLIEAVSVPASPLSTVLLLL